MDSPTKAKMHSAIDLAQLDGATPVVFIAFDKDGDSSDTSFFYGDQGQLTRLLYHALGQVAFAPKSLPASPDIDVTRN